VITSHHLLPGVAYYNDTARQRTEINGESIGPWSGQPSDRRRLENRTELVCGKRWVSVSMIVGRMGNR